MSIDLHTLSGAFAIDALSPDEAQSFAKHLDACPACRQEVLELQEAAARMGAIEAAPAPSALRARVLAAADQQRQLPPKVTPIEFARSRSRRWRSTVAGAAAAAVLLVGGFFTLHQLQGPADAPIASGSVSQVFQAADAHVATFRTTDGRTVRLATSSQSGQLAIQTGSLRTLNASQVYQMWARHNGQATSVGVLDDPKAGKVMPIPTFGTTVAITIEPAGGSKRPTARPIIEVNPQTI